MVQKINSRWRVEFKIENGVFFVIYLELYMHFTLLVTVIRGQEEGWW